MGLYAFQKPVADQMVRELERGRVFVLASTTGSGKTYMALDAIGRLGTKALVICPKVARSQWVRAAEEMGVADRLVGVTNPEQIAKPSGCVWYTREGGWRLPPNCLVVFDEFHRSASGSEIGRRTKPVTAFAVVLLHALPSAKLLAMSATIADTTLKFWALGYWLGFHNGTKAGFQQWCLRNGCAWKQYGFGPRRKHAFEFTKSKLRAAEIMRQVRLAMGDRFVSMGPGEIPGFPEEVREVCYVDLDKRDHDEIVAAYEAMPESYRQMAKEDQTRLLRERQRAEFCKMGAVAELVAGHVAEGCSVFVAVNFTDARLRLQEALDAMKIRYATIYGGQKEQERQDGIDAFQRNEVFVMVGMSQACSVAVSLHDVHHERPRVGLICPGYNGAEFIQALGRIRRVGGTAAVNKIVIAADTVEERVGRTIERKVCTIDALNGTEITDDDLRRK